MIKIFETKTWWIARGEYVAYGISEAGTQLGTPNETLEEYDNESEWTARLQEFGVQVEKEYIEVTNETY